ncbi:unnamed protein product [Rhodiola kirilowii]
MALKEDLKLFGFFASPYVHRVLWALKLTRFGIRVYRGGSVQQERSVIEIQSDSSEGACVGSCEGDPLLSQLVILEYIAETWPKGHRLLPTDPYEARSGSVLDQVWGRKGSNICNILDYHR